MENIKDQLREMSEKLNIQSVSVKSLQPLLLEAADLLEAYEEVNEDKKRLVRELDVALNGENDAAKQASLCDIVAIVKSKELKVIQRHEYEMLHRQIHNYKRHIEDYCP
jgi:uncharacterized protein YfkK (UPF0435 family)